MSHPLIHGRNVIKCISCELSDYHMGLNEVWSQDPAAALHDDQMKHNSLADINLYDVPFATRNEYHRYCRACFMAMARIYSTLKKWHKAHMNHKGPPQTNRYDDRPLSYRKTSIAMSICDFSEDFDYCYECFMECDKLFELQICKHLRRITRLDNTALHFTKQGIETGLVFEALFKQGPRSLEYIRERAEADLICITCNWVFRNGDEARDHRIGRHLGLRDAGDNIIQLDESAARYQDLAIRAFICTVCGITCPTQERLDTHQSVGHPVAWYCSVCDRTCSTYDEMEDHNWDLHQGCVRYNIRRARATFTCTTCNMSYNDQRQLDQHVIRKHTAPPTVRYISPEGSWYCSACNRDFYSQCAVNEHNRDTHWGRRSFCLPRAYAASTCVTCNRRFNNYDELLTHTANQTLYMEFYAFITVLCTFLRN